MSKVFVTQQSMSRDKTTGAFRPTFDLSPAAQHGTLEFIFGSGQVALLPDGVRDAIKERLDECEFDPHKDYLLSTGDPALGMHVAYMMMQRGGCRILRWDKRYRRYDVYNMPEEEYAGSNVQG